MLNKRADLRTWFKERWVDISRKKQGGGHPPCGRDDADKGAYPKCVPAAKARTLSKNQKKSAVRRKRAGGQGKGKTPKFVSTMNKQALLEKLAKNVPTNPELWSRAKAQARSKFDKYPSAYANGWAAKWYKSKGGGWKKEAAVGSTKLAFTVSPTAAAAMAIGAPAYLGHQAGQTAGKYTASKVTPRGNKTRNEELARRLSGLAGAAGGLGAAYAMRGRRSDSVRKAVSRSLPELTPEELKGVVDLALPAAAGIGGGLAAGAATGALIGGPARVKSMLKKRKDKKREQEQNKTASMTHDKLFEAAHGIGRSARVKSMLKKREDKKREQEQTKTAEKGIKNLLNAKSLAVLGGTGAAVYGIHKLKKRQERKNAGVTRAAFQSDNDFKKKAAAWTRKEGKNPEGGLNQKGVESYRRQNPGSKLQTAVTTKPSKLKRGSKAAKRRKSFCRRMKGMKAKLTSAKTARDPDSRINKSLRKWNC